MSNLQRSINFFGDGSQDTQIPLSQILLAQKDGSLLSQFISHVSAALRDEYMKLPVADRNGIPIFQNLNCLVRQPGDQRRPHPALHPTELVLVQLACFIAAYEQYPHELYPRADQNICVGLCFGELSAAAVSLAKSLTELLPLAVETVRITFRAGIVLATVGEQLEGQDASREGWSFSVPRDCGLADNNNLEDACNQLGILGRKKAYVTALSPKSVTIGGPPSTLNVLIDHLERNSILSSRHRPHRVPVFAPYHAPHLYFHEDVAGILGGLPSLDETFHTNDFPGPQQTLLGAATGEYYYASSRRDLLEKVLYNVLAQPIRWENVLDGCASQVANSETQRWAVRPFGPGPAAKSLASTLKAEKNLDITFDDAFGSSSSQAATSKRIPLAIIGMAGRFPSAANHDNLWKVLEQGLDCHRIIPTDRFNAKTHLSKACYGCFIDEPGAFDARFFNLSPREAMQTDPGQRLALATAYEALENAGYVPNRTPSTQLDRIGTFYGQTSDEYKEQNMAQKVGTYFIPGGIRAFGPGRINFHFKFGGPAYSVDTACSSSLVALNMACNSIWSNECDTALAGGMNIVTGAKNYEGLSAGHFLSETGGCKTYDDTADGYCRGEAVGSVVVKRLDAAQADNDNILATILSTASNYPAESVSITHPHAPTQETLYRQVLSQAGIRPFDVDYIEMHGTGTQAGDAVEMSSISNVFAPATPSRPVDQPLYISATKANLGHGEAASGVTALIKTLLVLREKKLPCHVGIKSAVNHTFPDLEARNIKIPREVLAFPSPLPKRRRRLLVNNFSAAGGNTALILEEPIDYHPQSAVADLRPDHIINVTAKTSTALRKNTQNLIDYLDHNDGIRLSDLSYTTTARRIQHPIRTSLVASTTKGLKQQLAESLEKGDSKAPQKHPQVAFAFTGQGSLYSSLGKDLFESSRQFRGDLTRFDQISKCHGFPSFLPVIVGSVNDFHTLRPVQTQLAITATQMALCRLWESWGIRPDLVIGHSLGEYAALYASDVLTASDTLYLVGQRAILLEDFCTMRTHSMLAAHITVEAAKKVLGQIFENMEVACINGPGDTVLSGSAQAVEEASQMLQSNGTRCTILKVPFAFHSSQVDPILEPFEKAASVVNFTKPRIPIISPLFRSIVKESGVVNPVYLRRHAREPVNFHEALKACKTEGLIRADSVWLELGPHPLCLAMVKASLGGSIQGSATLRKDESSWTTACKSLARLCTLGLDVVWGEYHRDFEAGQRLLILPTYAFEEKNYWIDYKNDWLLTKSETNGSPYPSVVSGPATTTVQRLISQEAKDGKASLVFETNLADPAMHAAIIGHLINGTGLCPASVYADMALTIGDYIRREYKIQVPATGINILDMEIPKPITVLQSRPEGPQLVRISAFADLSNGHVELKYSKFSMETRKIDPSAKCTIKFGDSQNWLDQWARTAYLVQKRIDSLEDGVHQGTVHKIFRGMAYKLFANLVHYEPNYQGMHEVLLDSDALESAAVLKLQDVKDAGNFFFSPFWIDSFAHLAGFVMNANDTIDSSKTVYISHGWESMRFAETIDPKMSYRVHVKMQPLGKSMVAGDISIFRGGTMVGMIGDLKFQQVPRALLDSMLPSPSAPHTPQSNLQAPSNPKSPPKPSPMKITPGPAPADPSPKILDIIAEEIGIPAGDLSDDSDFSELGVDSLLSLTILSKLRETLQQHIPQNLFHDLSTVGDLRRHFQIAGNDDDDYSSIDDTPPSSNVGTPESLEDPVPTVVDDTISIIRSTVAEQIGIEVEELLAADDLTEFGVDSLMSLSILGALREKTGLTIPRDAISEDMSMSDFEKTLGPSSAAPSPSKARLKQTSPSSKPQAPLSFLLQGSQKSALKTIFLFPDGSGSATSYEKLPKISDDVCVFGLNSPFLRASDEYTTSIEGIAEIWVDEIRKRQSQGPYNLAGWSAGGYYAYEATKQLIAAGELVESLILIDSPCRLVFEAIPSDLLSYLSKNGLMGADPKKATPAWLVKHFSSTIKAVEKYEPTPIEPAKVPKTFIIWASEGVFEDLNAAETELDLTIKVTKFMLQRKDIGGPQGWEKLLSSEAIETATTDGTHFTLVQPPNCEALSRLIGEAVANDPSKRKGNWRSA